METIDDNTFKRLQEYLAEEEAAKKKNNRMARYSRLRWILSHPLQTLSEYWYYLVRAKYFVVKRKLSDTGTKNGNNVPVMNIEWERYLSMKNKEIYWADSPGDGTVVAGGFFTTTLLRRHFAKKETDNTIEYCLAECGDALFIHDVTEGK